MEYEFPGSAPKQVKELLREVLAVLHSILQEYLVGIYLYGSLAMECFNPKSSDIDVILVVKERLSKENSKRIVKYLKRACSKQKRLELSIIGADVVENPTYPLMVYLHYEYWGNVFEDERDNEILSNLYTTKERGFLIWGAPLADVFSKIPSRYHLRSVMEDIEHTRKYLHKSQEQMGYNVTMHWILGSCRVLAFIREGKVLSKLEGGQWGLTNLPKEHHAVVLKALSCYRGEDSGQAWSERELDDFADCMSNIIARESKHML